MKIKAPSCASLMAFNERKSSITFIVIFLLLLLPSLLQAQFNFTTNADNTLTITHYSGPGGAVTIPTNINGLTVTSIGALAFQQCSSLTMINIPDQVTSIDALAFAACTSLTSVTIPPNVAGLGESAFSNCSGLTNAILYGITTLEDETFADCTSLKKLALPATMTDILGNPFVNCPNLTEVFFLGNFPYQLSGLPDSGVVFSDNPNVTVYCLPGTTYWTFCTLATGITPVLWNPLIQTGNGNFGVQNNQFGFDITGTSGIPIVVEASTNLANPVWTSLTNVMLTNGSFHFSDSQWTNYPTRYYGIGFP